MNLRRIIDILMTVALMLLMSSQVTGQEAHEYTGITMFVLFLVHQVRGIDEGTLYSPQNALDSHKFLAAGFVHNDGVQRNNNVREFPLAQYRIADIIRKARAFIMLIPELHAYGDSSWASLGNDCREN